MVALAIFSLAALALIRLQAFSLRSGGDVIAHDFAWQVARNRAADLMTDPSPPVLGDISGEVQQGGLVFRWQQSTRKTDDARIIRIDLNVEGDLGGQANLKLARPLQI